MRGRTVYLLVGIAVAAALVVVCAAAGIFVVARALDDGKERADRTELVVRATGPDGQPAANGDVRATIGTLTKRLKSAGLSDIGFQPRGDGRLTVTATGKDSGELMPQLLRSGHLRFRELLAELPTRSVSTTPPVGPSAPTGPLPSRSHVLAKFPAEADKLVRTVPAESFQAGTPPMFDVAARLTPDEVSVLPVEWQYKVPQIDCSALSARPAAATEPPEEQIVACEDQYKLHLGPATLLGTDVKEATTTDNGNDWGVAVEMTADGKTKLAAVTRALTNRRLAIVHDGHVVSSPEIMEPLTDGNLEITGKFTLVEAVSLAAQLQSGALGITLQVERTKITRVPTR